GLGYRVDAGPKYRVNDPAQSETQQAEGRVREGGFTRGQHRFDPAEPQPGHRTEDHQNGSDDEHRFGPDDEAGAVGDASSGSPDEQQPGEGQHQHGQGVDGNRPGEQDEAQQYMPSSNFWRPTVVDEVETGE